MKSKKLFEITNFINFISSSAFIGMVYYISFSRDGISNNEIALTAFSLMFFVVILPFNWICYRLHKTYKQNQQLLKSIKIAGTIWCILFSLLTILEIYGITDIIGDLIKQRYIDREFRFLTFFTLFFCITITSLYLSIAYWIVRKQTKTQFVDIVAEIGQDNF